MARKKQPKQIRTNKLNKSSKAGTSSVRIIAGQWRGRKLSFADGIEGLRPTPDRTRETLFNWLQSYLYEARCLDLFAGSGALGFEALSRGAAQVTFVEKHPRVVMQLDENRRLLAPNDDIACVVQADAISFLQEKAEQIAKIKTPVNSAYDVIFLDPPFHQGLLPGILDFIEKHSLLAPSGMLYMEYANDEKVEVPTNSRFILHKQNKVGQVVSCLYTFG